MNLITPAQAEQHLLSALSTLPTETTTLSQALGRTLAQDLLADRPFPPFHRVTMDGIAFHSSSTPPFLLHGTHPAGAPTPAPLPQNSCWEIMTGASLPPDCDTIVPYEEVTLDPTHAHLTSTPTPGKFIHRTGTDAQPGDLLVPTGTPLTPATLGLAASIGATTLTVSRLPRIAIFSTGDELIPPDQTPLPHQLRQSNALTLQAAIHTWGPAQTTLTHLPDNLTETTNALAAALDQNDLIILTGGISKGTKDFVRPALESLIGPPLFHRVAQRPGKPLAAWTKIAALPGNPNSTLLTFQRYLIPALHILSGRPLPQTIHLPLTQPITPHPKLTLFLPSTLSPEGKISALTPQNSGDFVTPLLATGFAEIPPGDTPVSSANFRSF